MKSQLFAIGAILSIAMSCMGAQPCKNHGGNVIGGTNPPVPLSDTDRLQAILDSCSPEVTFPDGTYEITRALLISENTKLVCSSNVILRLAAGANCPLITNRPNPSGGLVSNITVEGGLWDGNNTQQDRTKYATRYPWMGGQGMIFEGVTNLVVRNLTIKDTNTFGMMITDIIDFTIENIHFDDNDRTYNEDGVHVNGYAYHGRIRNISGHTNDDLVALNSDEGEFRSSDCTIKDVLIDGLEGGDNGYTAVRLLSRNARVEDVTIRNIHGAFKYNIVSFTHWAKEDYKSGMGHFDNILIEDLTATCCLKSGTNHGGLIWFQDGVHDVGTVTIRNYSRVEGPEFKNASCTIDVSDNVHIRNLIIHNVTQNVPVSKPLIKIGSTAIIDNKTVD